MSLSFFILALLPALLAPTLTYRAASAAYDWQRRQIAVDNAAIRLGEADIALARGLIRGNTVLENLERAHHPAHECAHSPLPAPPCVALDESLEVEILLQHQLMRTQAEAHWQGNRAEAIAMLSKEQVSGAVQRDGSAPIHSVFCMVCQLQVYWEKSAPFDSTISSVGSPSLGTRVTVDGRSLRREAGWNYQLAEGAVR